MEALIREAKRIVLGGIHKVTSVYENRHIRGLLERYDSSVVHNAVPSKPQTVLFVVTRMVRFHGGQTSVLRLGTQLAGQGFNVIYSSYKKQSREEMELCALANLSGYAGCVMPLSEYLDGLNSKDGNALEAPDIVFATSWDTVSVIKPLPGYKMYFVQDYEPYFYKFGEEFFMARATYEQGLHMVCLGAWNKAMIERDTTPISPVDVISFPFERSEYPTAKRNYGEYSSKKKIVLAVYLKYYGKRLPNLIPYMLENTAVSLKKQGIELEVRYFGEAKSFKVKGGINLGQLNKSELRSLYEEADFGMVASMSNISLVPYEMLSSGLPIIEFEDGTFPYFFPKNSAILTRTGAGDIAGELLEAISHPEHIAERMQTARSYMEGLSWEQTGKECADIIRSLNSAD